MFTDPWLSPAVEFARRVFISHSDSASPFDSMLGGFALAELIAAKVVTATGDVGRTRVGELEAVGVGDFMKGPDGEMPVETGKAPPGDGRRRHERGAQAKEVAESLRNQGVAAVALGSSTRRRSSG